jgi:tRNA threonylcarbamoyladenosine biosynthesis protein TsaE
MKELSGLEINNYFNIAEKLIKSNKEHNIFLFEGDLGSGKTTFIQELSKFLLIKDDNVNSPTFSLINEYYSDLLNDTVYHMDFYRISKAQEALDIGIEHYLYNKKYCFIEWGSLIRHLLPKKYVQVNILVQQDQKRTFIINTYG